MQRREFLQGLAATAVATKLNAASTIPRRTYKGDVKLPIIGFGGIVVVGMEQPLADKTVAAALDRGVNYFDVAPSYFEGEAERKLGPALQPYRKQSFLACKTMARDAAGARKELEESLQRLKTDHFDLYQFHAVSKPEEVAQILGPGGAAETFVKARQEGKVRFLGASVHDVKAAAALMDGFSLDSVMFPLNFVLVQEGNFGPQILAQAKSKGISRIALKTLAYTSWPKGQQHEKWKKCWYEPIDNPALAEKAFRFTLSEDITAAIPPGDENLFQMAMGFAERFTPMDGKERRELLAQAKGVQPIFRA
jgi:aryl-alcohol dehydrogenase-like predicted oxidoreductase